MLSRSYEIAINVIAGFVYRTLNRDLIQVTGRDRLTFLQGQLSNDLNRAQSAEVQHTCLLNNTGHLIADLLLLSRDNAILLITDPGRGAVVTSTLDRFVIREKVAFESVTSKRTVIELRGNSAQNAAHSVIDALKANEFDGLAATALNDRTFIIAPAESASLIQNALIRQGGIEIDDLTAECLRVESGQPKWGSELDETVIPLEAGFADAISYSKGCYMGQEIIARIHSRGHTNRQLVGLTFHDLSDENVEVGPINAISGERAGSQIGRVTSIARSPRYGLIALGILRKEFADTGSSVGVQSVTASVTSLPFDR